MSTRPIRRFRLAALWLHWIGLFSLFGQAAVLWLMAFFSDNRDRSEDLWGLALLVGPFFAVAAVALVTGLLLTIKERPRLSVLHRVTAIITLVGFGLWLGGANVFGLPVMAACWLALKRRSYWLEATLRSLSLAPASS